MMDLESLSEEGVWQEVIVVVWYDRKCKGGVVGSVIEVGEGK